MTDVIKLVQGDTYPEVFVTLTDEFTGVNVNLTGATVELKFRATGTTTVLSTIACTIVTPTSGIFKFSFAAPVLTVAPGLYEGEIQVTFPGSNIQSVYDVLKFRIRQQF